MLAALLLATVPLVAIAVILGLRSPVGVLVAAYAAIVPLGSAVDLPIPVPAPFDTLSSIAGALATAAMAAQLLLLRRGAARLSSGVPLWLVFVGLAGTTFAWSINPAATVKEVLLLVSVVTLFVLAALLPVTSADVHRLGTAIVAGATIASLLGIALFVSGRAPIGKSGAPRFLITGDDPNHTAAGLLLPIVLAIWRAVDRRGSLVERCAWGASAAAMGVGIVLTGSRGGIAAAMVAVGAIAVQTGSARRVGGVLVVLLVVALLAMTTAPETLQQRLLRSDSTGRTEIWRLGLAACSEHCLVGSGWGTFPDVYQDQFRTNPEAGGYRTQGFRAHNIWLQALIELGVGGLVLLVGAFLAMGRDILRLPREERAPPLAAVLSIAVASSLVSNLTFKYFWLVLMYAAFAVNGSRVGKIPHGAAAPVAAGAG